MNTLQHRRHHQMTGRRLNEISQNEDRSKQNTSILRCFEFMYVCVCVCVCCLLYSYHHQTVSEPECVCFLYPSCQCIIDLDGPVGRVLTADRDTREPAISQTQHAHYPRAHDNSCLVPAQGQGCNCTYYVMTRTGGGQEEEEEEKSEGRDFTGMLVNA